MDYKAFLDFINNDINVDFLVNEVINNKPQNYIISDYNYIYF